MTDEEQIARIKERFEDEDDKFGQRSLNEDHEWPPTDAAGNEYPLDWFDIDDVSESGWLYDNNNRAFSPFQGNLEPIGDKCNALLSNWRKRYDAPRYCGQFVPKDPHSGELLSDWCRMHKNREGFAMKTAEEALQTGLYTKTVDHYYAKLGPWKRLTMWGLFESLMGDSTYEYAEEYEPRQFDFGEEDSQPLFADEDGLVEVEVAYPTQYLDRALALFSAAADTMKMMAVQPRIMSEQGEDEGVMESKTISHADLTAPPNEHDPSPQQYKTLEEWTEHHLNLPYSRLARDKQELLEYGGVATSTASDDVSNKDIEEIHLELPATTDEPSSPNAFGDEGPISEAISDKVDGESLDDLDSE